MSIFHQFRFRLRTLLMLVFVVSLPLAWYRLPHRWRFALVQEGQPKPIVAAIMGLPLAIRWQEPIWIYSDGSVSYRVSFSSGTRVPAWNRAVDEKSIDYYDSWGQAVRHSYQN